MKSGDTIRVSEMKEMPLPREPHEMTPEELLAIEISEIFVKEEINGHSWRPMSTTNVRAYTKTSDAMLWLYLLNHSLPKVEIVIFGKFCFVHLNYGKSQ